MRDELPDHQPEGQQSNTAQRRPRRFDAGFGFALAFALLFLTAYFLILFRLMLLHQRHAGREDSGERQEQPAHHGTILLGDPSGQGGHDPTEHEANRIFIPFRAFERRWIDFHFHSFYPQRSAHKPSATTNQGSIATTAASSAGHLQRRSSQLTTRL